MISFALLEFFLVLTVALVLVTLAIHMSLRVFGKPVKREWKTIYAKTIPNHQDSVTVIKNYLFKPKTKMERTK